MLAMHVSTPAVPCVGPAEGLPSQPSTRDSSFLDCHQWDVSPITGQTLNARLKSVAAMAGLDVNGQVTVSVVAVPLGLCPVGYRGRWLN